MLRGQLNSKSRDGIRRKVQKIQKKYHAQLANKHAYGASDPQQKWERKVISPYRQRPEIIPFNHRPFDVIFRDT
jgi:hypothetical protein